MTKADRSLRKLMKFGGTKENPGIAMTLPKNLCNLLQLGHGDQVQVEIVGNQLAISKVAV